MSVESPELWKQLSNWIWAALAAPIVVIWRKANGAASREELREAVADLRDTCKTLFANAEEERRRSDDRFAEMTREMHAQYRELRDRIGNGHK